MRRAGRLVASILIVLTTIGQSFAIGSVTRLGAAADRYGAVEALPSAPAGEIATESTPRRAISAAELNRRDANAVAASAVATATLRSLGRFEAPFGASTRHAFEPDAARGRAPPLSR